jgi:glyceraldehyde-3-phosphate dehydrogenase (NADP+)
MLSFTGSPQVGWLLKARAGRKKVVLELGGNAGVIVDKSANVEDAVRKNVMGAFAYGGQTCIKVQRIFVHSEITERYIEAFIRETKSLKVGDPHSPETIVGPLVDKAAAERVVSWVEESVDHGAEILCGGKSQGCVVEPTVLLNVRRTEKVFCNEIFGPVVTIHSFDDIGQAVAGINDSAFGLQAGIFTNDFKNILFAYDNIEAGGVVVNDNPTFRIDNMPYGGTKQSGLGREGLKYAIEEMTEPKLLAINPS